jgi:hypothetical protein
MFPRLSLDPFRRKHTPRAHRRPRVELDAAPVGQLFLQALALQGTARPGSYGSASVDLVVQSDQGFLPGLLAADFALDATRVRPAEQILEITSVHAWALGLYHLEIMPSAEGRPWMSGDYVLPLLVAAGSRTGECLTWLRID